MASKNFPVFSEIDEPWVVDRDARRFTSPRIDDQDAQRLIFNEIIRDGRIAATITVEAGKPDVNNGKDSKAGSIIFRFIDKNNYYYAGVGDHGKRFIICKNFGNSWETSWRILDATGDANSIEYNKPHRIEVHCSGNKITLRHNGIVHLTVFDNDISAGLWGFQSWKSKVKFSDPEIRTVKAFCFVIMPFAVEFDGAYTVIEETVKKLGLDCMRADKRYFSGPIMTDVFDQIERSSVVIADFTGKNPNVFYEAGYAAAIRKPAIQIAQSVEDLPFDVRHLRTFQYSTKWFSEKQLAYDIDAALRANVPYLWER